MLGQALKLVSTVAGVARHCGAGTGLRYAIAVAASLPAILRERTLQAPDRAMRGAARVRYRGREIAVPFGAVDAANPVAGDACTFSGVRELYLSDVYGRGFRRLGPCRTAVDLGANRGMVSLMAARGLGAETVLSVEAQDVYESAFRVLADANGLSPRQRLRVVATIGGHDEGGVRSVDGLCAEHGIDAIDFLKCDVEGAENAVVLDGAAAFLGRTGLIAMELHPAQGTRTAEIAARLAAAGLHVSVADQDGRPAGLAGADYLYAARDGANLTLPIVAGPR